MSYKVKSLLYFAAFVASAFVYNSMNTEVPEKTVVKPVKMENSVTDNAEMGMQEEAALLEETLLKN
jgi:hypothetical protein